MPPAKTLSLVLRFLLVPVSIFLLSFFFNSCTRGKRGPVNSNVEQPEFAVPKTTIRPTALFKLSTKKEDVALCKEIEDLIQSREADFEKWGLMAVSLKDGRVPCALNATQLFRPASIQKLVTAAVALDKLGSDFIFTTSLFAASKPVGGVIDGDLILYGRGAPDFDTAAAQELVSKLKSAGVKQISGDIVGDESYFRADGLGDGWTWNSAQWYYGAAASALSFERNLVNIKIVNGKPTADRNFEELSGELKPVETIEAIGIKRRLGTNRVYVWGNGKNLAARIAVANPALFAARIFKETLEKSGIRIIGKVRLADWQKPAMSDDKIELASVESAPLSVLVKTMNRDSVNLFAELMIRTLGKKFGGQAPDEDAKMNLLRGVDMAGAAFVEKWLNEKKILSSGTSVHDGSGLSQLDRVTPEMFARLLVLVSSSDYAKTFTESLPVSGQSGTLRARLKTVTGKVAAKTGSIQYVNSLAGFAKSDSETIAFAIICNDETTRKDSSITVDRIAVKLAGEKQ